MRKLDLTLQLTDIPEAPGRHTIAATAFLPEVVPGREPRAVLFAFPGGGYARGYYDVSIPGLSSYSQAEHHTANGLIVIAVDHVGVGDSRSDDNPPVDRAGAAAVNDRVVRGLRSRLAAGTLAVGLPPLPGIFVVAMGQSMGGCLSIIMQGCYASCDALAVLGYSALHTRIPQPTAAETDRAKARVIFSSSTDVDRLADEEVLRAVPPVSYAFFWEDVPEAIRTLDLSAGYPIRHTSPPWGSLTLPRYGLTMTAPGVVSREAAAIKVPVLLAFGERDVSENPWAEPAAYGRSCHVSLYVVPRMAHMHNFAGTRALLWNRVVAWVGMQLGASLHHRCA
jgi:pimeloyl-ACP methyl ester carboxylesterase